MSDDPQPTAIPDDAAIRIDQVEGLLLMTQQLGAVIDLGTKDLDDLIVLWDRLDRIRDTVSVLQREAAALSARKIGGSTEYTHPSVGIVHTASNSSAKCDGDGILFDLALDMIDTATGEKELAVPLSVLREVVPATNPGQTSSKWKKSGLKKLLGEEAVNRHIRTEYGQSTTRRGPKPKR